MKTLYFQDIADLCEAISDEYEFLNDEFADISVIAKYDEAREIIKELLCNGYEIASIDIQREEFNDYFEEYIISLNFDGVWCEKFKRDNGYFYDDSSIAFVSNECNSACLPYVESKTTYAFEIKDEDNKCEDKKSTDLDTSDMESTHVSRDKDGAACGFSKSWSTAKDGVSCYSSYSHYSSDVDELRKVAEKFGIRL